MHVGIFARVNIFQLTVKMADYRMIVAEIKPGDEIKTSSRQHLDACISHSFYSDHLGQQQQLRDPELPPDPGQKRIRWRPHHLRLSRRPS
jgi:hypothetical protein